MKKISFYIILVLVGWSLSCDAPSDPQADDQSDQTDYTPVNMPISNDSYPSIYNSLLAGELSRAIADYYILNNQEVCSSLDRYGWPEGDLGDCLDREILRQEITDEAKMIIMTKNAIVRNGAFTGVTDTVDLVVRSSRGHTGCVQCDGSEGDRVHIAWSIIFANQVYQRLEVLSTGIWTRMDDEKVYLIGGHWYPEIHIPEIDQISPDSARECLIGTDIVWHEIGGEPNVYTVTSESFLGEAEKVVVPVEDENSIELRVTWRIGVTFWLCGPDYPCWYIYVDTTTGETVLIEQLFDT